ncbi:MAG TPA: group-specific protein [Candidatus Onthousia faecavium]|nr:group-specific protein [Candidatus Onthousia faecavium]
MKFYVGSGMKNANLVEYYQDKLKEAGWEQTYNWVKNINSDINIDEIKEYAKLEQEGVMNSDVVVILLKAGRGAHIELGMSIALNKKTFLCSITENEFSLENTVAFYELPNVVKLVGTPDENIKEILKFNKEKEMK